MLNGRCRMHGGQSLSAGIMHPTYKHGYYSRSLIARMPWESFERAQRSAAYVAERLGHPHARLTARGLIETARDMDNGREMEEWQAPYAELLEAWSSEPGSQ